MMQSEQLHYHMTHYKLYDSLCSGSFYFVVCRVNL